MLTSQGFYPDVLGRIPAGCAIIPDEFVTVNTVTRALAQAMSAPSLARTNLVVHAGHIPLAITTPVRKKDLPALDQIARLLLEMAQADYTESARRVAISLQQGGIVLIQEKELASRIEDIFATMRQQRGQKTFPPRMRMAASEAPQSPARSTIDWSQKLKEWDPQELALFILEQPETVESHLERILELAEKHPALSLVLAYLAWKMPKQFPLDAITTILNTIGPAKLYWVPAWTLEAIRYPQLLRKMMGTVETPTFGLSWALYFLVKSRSEAVAQNRKLMLTLSTIGHYNPIVAHAHNLALQTTRG